MQHLKGPTTNTEGRMSPIMLSLQQPAIEQLITSIAEITRHKMAKTSKTQFKQVEEIHCRPEVVYKKNYLTPTILIIASLAVEASDSSSSGM